MKEKYANVHESLLIGSMNISCKMFKYIRINYQTKRNRLIETENRLTAVRGEGVRGLGEKGKGLSKEKITPEQTAVW